MNLQKTKIMNPYNNLQVRIYNRAIEWIKEYVYLGHTIKLGKNIQIAKITRRIGLGWAAFGRLNFIHWKMRVALNLTTI